MTYLILFIIYLLFILWYYGIPKKISPAEGLELKAKLKTALNNNNEPDNEQVKEFCRLMESDDGKSFIMVNLIKYRKESISPKDENPKKAMQKYMQIMIPNLLKRAAHPFYMGKVMGDFIMIDNNVSWDEVACLRYRSRRDMINMVIQLSSARNEILARGEEYPDSKDEAVEITQVFPVKSKLQLSYVPIIVAIILLIISSYIN